MEDKIAKTRKVTVNPINEANQYSTFPIDRLYMEVIQGQNSIMHFIGQILGFWGYSGPTDIDVSDVDLNRFHYGEVVDGSEILEKAKAAIKVLHFRNRDNREEHLKDIGRITWLMEEYSHRIDRYCTVCCSDRIPLRFPDVYEFCGVCGARLETKEYLPPRFRKKKAITHATC